MTARLAILATVACVSACAGPLVRPALSPSTPRKDALLVLPGFGYGRPAEKALRSLAASMGGEGVDLYVPTYVTRTGLVTSRAKLDRFIRENRLDRYERLHVFAFLAGAWTLNPLLERHDLPNLATVIYDRSPLQERAPWIAVDKVPVLAWALYGSTVFDVAREPYPALAAPNVKVGLMVESKPTSFIRRYGKAARDYGPFAFACDGLMQRYDDCLYLPMNHNEVYTRFADVWPELLTFIRTGRFSERVNRRPPVDDPLPRRGRP
jgi:hypothetical protein